MKTATMRVLVTGASGGIGGALAVELHRRGAALLLVGRTANALQPPIGSLRAASTDRVETCVADLATEAGRRDVVRHAVEWGCNVLVNNAGLSEFALVDQQTDDGLERLFAINVVAPMQLTRALLPHLRGLPEAAVLNVGSVFGSLGFAGYSAYSATKFALRGYTEALRRELADTGVRIHYLAPRATRTGMNVPAVERMNAELGVAMDTPEFVARAACHMLEQGRREAVLGWPEKAFVRINAVMPRVVDGSLRKRLAVILRHARSVDAAHPEPTPGGHLR